MQMTQQCAVYSHACAVPSRVGIDPKPRRSHWRWSFAAHSRYHVTYQRFHERFHQLDRLRVLYLAKRVAQVGLALKIRYYGFIKAWRATTPFRIFPTTMGARYQPSLGEVGLDLVRVSSLASADDLPGGRHVR